MSLCPVILTGMMPLVPCFGYTTSGCTVLLQMFWNIISSISGAGQLLHSVHAVPAFSAAVSACMALLRCVAVRVHTSSTRCCCQGVVVRAMLDG
jgi:hypothetical protein